MSKDIKAGIIKQTLKQNLKDLVVGADELKQVDKECESIDEAVRRYEEANPDEQSGAIDGDGHYINNNTNLYKPHNEDTYMSNDTKVIPMKALEQPILYREDEHGRKVIDNEQMLEDFTQSLEDFALNESPPPLYEMSIDFNGGGQVGEDVRGEVKVTIIQAEDEDMEDVKARAYDMVREACIDIQEITDADGNEVEDE